MATIRKVGRSWRAEVRRRGVALSQTFATKGEASCWANEQETEIMAVVRGQIPRKTFGDALRRYASFVSPTKKGGRWEEVRIAAMLNKGSAMHRLTLLQLSELSTPILAGWRDERLAQVSAPTVRREMNLVGSVLEVCRREWHWLRDNPLSDVRRPLNRPPRRRGITQAEIDRILLALSYEDARPVVTMSQQLAVAFLLSIETAMRQGEILSLTAEQIDLDGRVVRLVETKNGDRREVPLSLRAVELLRKVGVFKLKSGTADVYFRDARARSGCHDVHFHDARSEALTRLSKKLDVLELAKMVGHRDLKSLMLYYSTSAGELAKRLD